MEVESTETHVKTEEVPAGKSMDLEATENTLTKDKTAEVKTAESDAKAASRKRLPFDPAKIKAAVTKAKGAKSLASKTKGRRPTGVKKRTAAKPKGKGKGKGTTPSLGAMLLEARSWLVAPTSYMVRNADSGCFGLSARLLGHERAELTIVHTETCACLDVRLRYIAQHVDGVVRRKLLPRRLRDAFVLATKIRREFDHPIPSAARFPPVPRQVIRRPKKEVEAEQEIIRVVEKYRQQMLIEKWKNLTAYKERLIWKDW